MKRLALIAAIAVLLIGLTRPSEAASWKCGKRHCFWVGDYTGPVPDFAAGWGPPTCPGGYYTLSRLSQKWTQVCPPAN
jgi:hypothetical protein